MSTGEIKVSAMDFITSLNDDAVFYVVLPDGSYGKVKKSVLLAGLGGAQNLQQVIEAGGTVVDGDNLNKLVIDKETQSFTYYTRPTTGDVWQKVSEFTQAGFQFNMNDVFSTGIFGEFDPFVGFKVYDSLGNDITISPTSAAKNGVELSTINELATAISDLKDGVPTPGNTLQKLYNLILGASTEAYVANIAARDAYNVPHLPFSIFVTDDGDGRWAKYQATTTGIGATFVKLSDPDLLNAVMSAALIKIAYESNSDTNAFTNALKSKLDGIDLSQYLLLSNISNILTGTATNKALSEAKGKELKDLIDSLTIVVGGKQSILGFTPDKPTSWIKTSVQYTGTSSTALQKLSDLGSSGNGSYIALANKKYTCKVDFILSGLSPTSGTFSFGILGTSTISSITGLSLASRTSGYGTISSPSSIIITTTGATSLAATNSVAFAKAQITFEIITSGAGSIIPAFSVSQSTTPKVDYYNFEIKELGTDTQKTSTDII